MVRRHRFHLVDRSPWPLIISGLVFGLFTALVGVFNQIKGASDYFFFITLILVLVISYWFRDIIREAFLLGQHSKIVQKSLRIGVILFIVSEIMFFSSFFWAFFHSSLAPTIEIGSI